MSCRLVSNNWYDACSTVRLSNKIKMVIHNAEKLMALVDERMDCAPNDIPNIYEDVELPINVPIDDVPMSNFLTKFGHRMKRLVVPAGWSMEGLKNILFKQCVNLEELVLVMKGVIHRGRRQVVPVEGSEQESKSPPKLKKLRLEIYKANVDLPPTCVDIINPQFMGLGSHFTIRGHRA